MKKSPFFTIITASLNKGSSIRKTLESIKKQTFQDIEHIVVDGGSQDETLDILKKYEKIYNLIWISESDSGIANALNKGLRYARGEYIIVIQADDYLLNRRSLEEAYPLLKKGYDINLFSVVFDCPKIGRKMGKSIRLLWWNRFRNIFHHQGVFVKRSVFGRVGYFNENFSISMDYDFFYRALLQGCSVTFSKMPVSLMSGAGISSNISKRLKDEFQVQKLNEENIFWRIAQLFFQTLYYPYKLWLLPKIRKAFEKK